ncbi:alcohol dehydrogenase [Devosia yakushimensis]|uniref:Alcohol dehydrogenase n=1 Tax=Devosia yakushimensis TaxID=470028 RepID=A0ABQ5UMZ0_9HYPH|nr:iron-containing alcohol dehydrogenase [Devosia yakushimensis]GLQ12101.1 alcohol dehydrogenase [Devosia yakushimensis]
MTNVYLPVALRVGGGALRETAEAMKLFGLQRPAIITDAFMNASGSVQGLVSILTDGGIHSRIFDGVQADPTVDIVNAAVDFVLAGDHDSVIGFGGGSSIDTAKAVAVMAKRGGDIRSLKAPHQENNRGLPIVAIPTTAGTGSEATKFTIITDNANDEKMLCVGLAYLPTLAIVDFELSISAPPRLTADTGIDALTHALEAYVSRRNNPFSDAMALSAMRLIWPNLRKVWTSPGDRSAREAMMVGSMQAGIAFSNASVALVHGMSRPIGANFHVAHGLSNAMLLPIVTEWSISGCEERYADCARAMGIVDLHFDDAGAAKALVDALRLLNSDLQVPTPKAYGIDQMQWSALIPFMADQALASGSPGNNPRVPTADEIRDLYVAVWND